ncbi:AAA family ATPase [Magnetovibrio sp.]|uniref:AAA family ATPase n=1 Tax=Magnetovibrio sp. TaxID=2024836 RepID=UPI002F926711
MILRINIGAFVLTDAVRDAVSALNEDRLFLRSTVAVQEGGMAAALDYLSQRSTPELLVVETTAMDEELFNELNALAEVCQPGTKVIIIGAENDINLFKTLIDQGISQYFLETVTAEELKTAIVDAFADKTLNAKSRTIAFAGLRGGVGSSVLAHNVASELARLYDEDVIIVDLDIPYGTAALSYNLQPSQTIADAIAQAGSLDETMLMRYLETGGKNVSLLCAPGNLNSGIEITPNALEAVLNIVKQMASYVILDVPHMWNAWVQDVVVDADDTVIVGAPDLYNLRDGKNVFEFLSPNRGMEAPTRLVLNKVGELRKGELTEKEFKEVLGTKPSLSIPFDSDAFAGAMNNGEMLRKVAPKSKATQEVETLAKMVSGKESLSKLTKKSGGGLLGSLFKK